MVDDDLTAAVREAVARSCEVAVDAVTPASSLDALGMDSLAAAEVITDVEIRLGVDLPPDVLRGLAQAQTVADVLDLLRGALARQP